VLSAGESTTPAQEVGVGLSEKQPPDEHRRYGQDNLNEGQLTKPLRGQPQERPDGPRDYY
jgi:hypothetical protein